ncbi:uncharacterized protein LOC134261342, partial [Saccostrea cucullata]|uniref:uncharacterized protein LOC134261342 n=1 Tax=Saccostrea cuccullata TaxID=36930 RepID=UPI002ED13400
CSSEMDDLDRTILIDIMWRDALGIPSRRRSPSEEDQLFEELMEEGQLDEERLRLIDESLRAAEEELRLLREETERMEEAPLMFFEEPRKHVWLQSPAASPPETFLPDTQAEFRAMHQTDR